MNLSNELSVSVEKPSKVSRKLTVRVPAKTVADRFNRGLAEVQKTATLKGFRPGQAPLSVIKQFYGEDVRHRLFHTLIDESYQEALKKEKIRAVSQPKIETPEHQHGHGEHDHGVSEDKDLTYTATVEIMPELEIKNFKGFALTAEKTDVTQDQVDQVVNGLLDSRAELISKGGGLVGADGKPASSAKAEKGDFVDTEFTGGTVESDGTVKDHPGMKGARLIEIGSNSLIPGFEEELVGLTAGSSKTFRIKFPADYHEKSLQNGEAEFKVKVNEVKQKKLPALDDDFAKELGYDSVGDLKTKAREHLEGENKRKSESKLRNDLVTMLIEKNAFDCPAALIEAQTRALAQEWAQELKGQGANEEFIQQAIMSQIEDLKKRAESQVRSSLILESVADAEKINVSPQEFETELQTAAASMKVEIEKLKDFYEKNPARKDDMEFRIRQEKTLQFLLAQSKVKTK